MKEIFKQLQKVNPYIWLILAAVSLLFSTGRFSIGIFSWLAAIFALLYTRQSKTLPGYILISLGSFAALSIGWYGLQPLPLPFLLGTMFVGALLGNLPLLVDRLLFVKRQTFLNTLLYPLLATAWEFFSMNGSPLGSFGATAYSQVNNLVLMQAVSLAGIWGIAFLINWTGSVVSWILLNGFETKKLRPAISLFVLLALVFGFGALRLASAHTEPNELRVAGIIAQPLRNQFPTLMSLSSTDRAAFEEQTAAIAAENLAAAQEAVQQDADLVVFQEGAFFTTTESEAKLVAQVQAFSSQNQVYVVLPMFSLPPNSEEKAVNQVQIITPQGETGLTHIKFGGNQIEGTLAGSGELQTLTTPFGVISSVICWDMDFPQKILQAGQNGTEILFSPSSEWKEINPMHAQMAKTRGIETGVFNVHVAEAGLSMVSDPYGRILSTWENDRIHIVDMPVYNVPTLYAQTGDLFSMVCFLLGLLLVGFNLVSNFRSRKTKS